MAAGAGQAFFGADGHSVLQVRGGVCSAGMPFFLPFGAGQQPQVCDKLRLKDLLKEIDPNQALDDDVAELLVEMAHDFVDRVVTFSCQIARHRGSDTLEARDVQLHLGMAAGPSRVLLRRHLAFTPHLVVCHTGA